MPESPDADRIRHDALEEELEAARRKRDSYQALLKDLPEVFEGKFRERIRPLQQRNEELLQEGLALREQIRRALPEPASAGSLPAAAGSPPAAAANPPGAEPSLDPPALDPPCFDPPSFDPAGSPIAATPPRRRDRPGAASRFGPRRIGRANGSDPAAAPAQRLQALNDRLTAALGSLATGRPGLRPATVGAGLGLALLGLALGVLLPRQIPRTPAPSPGGAGSESAARPPAIPGAPGTLTLRSTGASWVEVQNGAGDSLYAGVLEGQRSFSLGAGLRIRSGRSDLIRLRIGGDPERSLGPVEMIEWQSFPPASDPG